MRKVLLSAYACMPDDGSEERNGWNYATLLSQEGLIIHCVTREKGRASIDAIQAQGHYPNLHMHYVPVPTWLERAYGNLIGMYCHYIYWQWKAAQLAKKIDKQEQFDIVHHVTYCSLQLGSFMYKLGKPFVFGPVGGGQRAPEALKAYFGPFWMRERIRDWTSQLLQWVNPGFYHTIKVADRVLISNTDTFQLVKQIRITKPIERVLDSGISASFLPQQPIHREPQPTMKLLWVGRLMPRKGLELTIEAFSRVNPDLPISLTIVGGHGQMAAFVPGYLATYSVADRVNWVGHVSYQEVKTFYEQSDVFFFTSLRDSCPMQLMEAMAYSLPVVTLQLHGQNEIVNDRNGLKIPVTTREEVVTNLAKAIEWLYYHPEERLAMGQNAYEYACSCVWDNRIKYYTNDLYPALFTQTMVEDIA